MGRGGLTRPGRGAWGLRASAGRSAAFPLRPRPGKTSVCPGGRLRVLGRGGVFPAMPPRMRDFLRFAAANFAIADGRSPGLR